MIWKLCYFFRKSPINVSFARSPFQHPVTSSLTCIFITDHGLIDAISVTEVSARLPTSKTIYSYTQVIWYKSLCTSRKWSLWIYVYVRLYTLIEFYHFLIGQKPHECKKCGKRFALGCNMKAHMKTHESPTSKFNIDIYSSKTEETNKHDVDENCPELEEEMSVDWKKIRNWII